MTKKIRRIALASLITGATVCQTGCTSPNGTSLSSMNPFSTANSTAAKSEKSTTEAIASSTKNAFQKSRDAVTGVFSKTKPPKSETSDDKTDPLRLDHKVEVGPEIFVANGRLWETTGNYHKAMESYTKALEAKANDPGALASIARLHVRQGNHKKGDEYFHKAIEQAPEDASLYNDIGLSFSKLGNHDAAVRMLTQSLELAPGTSRYANNLASVMVDGGESESAFKVLVSNNKPAVAHFNMAYLHQKRGQLNDARKHLNETMKYESLAKSDASIGRAIERSKEMLVQLDGANKAMNSIAQGEPTPPEQINSPPSRSALNVTNSATIRQTSQSVSKGQQLIVKPAVARTFATQPTNPAAESKTPARLAAAKLGRKSAATPAVSPKAPVSVPAIAKPAVMKPVAVEPAKAPPSDSSGKIGPAESPFVMPPGF